MPLRAKDFKTSDKRSIPQSALYQGHEQHGSEAPSVKINPFSPPGEGTTSRASLSPSPNTSPASSPPRIVLSSPSNLSSPVPLSPPADGVDYTPQQDTRRNLESPSRIRSRKSIDESSPTRASSSQRWSASPSRKTLQKHTNPPLPPERNDSFIDMAGRSRRARLRSPWSCSVSTLIVTALAATLTLVMTRSFLTRQLDVKGCNMSYMRPAFARFTDFDTEHTRFASKYSLFLYREGGIDEDTRVKGVPVLFIPGNAGSYKQVRPLAAQAAVHFHEHYQYASDAAKNEKVPLDVFTVDFNEDITAFHGQTMLDQAEYLNEAIPYILSLYHNPSRSLRDPEMPDPSSVILVGHSMGGIVARTMLTMPNYQSNSVNTIITLAAPHSKAPVSFDAEIIRTYKHINDYWRNSYSQQWASNNPLWHVTVISIAGGGLDTLVPSEYAAVSSIMPPTHGFAVFTATMPSVWTGMDHLAIMWCDQLRKSLIPALYDVIDGRRASQTQPRAERMRSFRKSFLTGMEVDAPKTLPQKELDILLIPGNSENSVIHEGRIILPELGGHSIPKAHMLPVPPAEPNNRKRFTFLTDQQLSAPGKPDTLDLLLCSIHPQTSSSSVFSKTIDLSGNDAVSEQLACKSALDDKMLLPSSNRESAFPFENALPFTYFQYNLEDLVDYAFVVVIDKSARPASGWALAEFSSTSDTIFESQGDMKTLLRSGLNIVFPSERAMMNEIKIPSVHSSLLAYKLSIVKKSCDNELFSPFLRQYISEPYESKFFVNVKEADINLHGIAPYLPQVLKFRGDRQGLSLQVWSDPSCKGSVEIALKVDFVGSLGKLWMRYRMVFATFPLIVVALVLRKQFRVYDESGSFISFSESMDQSLRSSIPVLYFALTMVAMNFATSAESNLEDAPSDFFHRNGTTPDSAMRSSKYDLLLGSQDPFFWFLVPLFGLISIGVCVLLNYAVLTITYVFSALYMRIARPLFRRTDAKSTGFPVSSLRKRVITTGILLLLVATAIPYQFVFMVLCIVQLATSVRALNYAKELNSGQTRNFYNYAHSILLLLLWILPINLPVFVVWIHNLAVHWLTPFSSHHNILSIMPFVLLIETLGTGKMIPRVKSKVLSHITGALFFAFGLGAAIYGVSYAYLLHVWVNAIVGWLACIHLSGSERVEWLRLGKVFGIGSDRSGSPTERERLKQEEGSAGEVKKIP